MKDSHEVVNVRSFDLNFTSESFLKDWVLRSIHDTDHSKDYLVDHEAHPWTTNKLGKHEQNAMNRPPSGQSMLSHLPHGLPRVSKLNNSELYNQ